MSKTYACRVTGCTATTTSLFPDGPPREPCCRGHDRPRWLLVRHDPVPRCRLFVEGIGDRGWSLHAALHLVPSWEDVRRQFLERLAARRLDPPAGAAGWD